ncbi:VWA domain-containing protein [Pseudomonas sp. WS 5011]|uniref:VWA domain-containing protein n=1 Tax=Pseudomonas sp. WS 5011 TaxID=2717477 RepID=UPI001473E7B3|nr:VWA domain-containing protein [Pseudomonas sp. WS 5011]NMY53458.1 tellurium resistance protein [Pseudomonas sp. WS 5011]
MNTLSQGQRIPVVSVAPSKKITVSVEISASATIDLACFGLDVGGKLSDDRYMIFFNQDASPCNAVRLATPTSFQLDLDQIPAAIDKLVFTAAIDGAGALSSIQASSFKFLEAGNEVARCEFSGATFKAERAVMLTEIYRKSGEWRINCVLQGFNEGLDALVRHFGGEVAEPAPTPAAAPARISLEKKVADKAPGLVNLAKKAQISLEKARLTDVVARVALVLDASGSMNGQYRGGHVQEVVNRLLPMAIHFDDDGEIDCWAFAAKPLRLSAVSASNYKDFINTDHHGWKDWDVGSRINDEPKAMQLLIDHYEATNSKVPVYVLFISDGGVHENRKITDLMKRAAALPIFWQFVGLGGSGYGILEKLDDMPGRIVDNCNFFALDKLSQISEEQLYEKLMEEFPDWLKAAKSKGII